MNRIRTISFSAFVLMACLAISVRAQQSKTYKETFNVGDDTVLNLDTSHADIEFETWDKDQVEIVATITLEDATKEDADDYFKDDPIKIVGNSKEIEVRTRGRNSWSFSSDFDFEPFVAPNVESFFMDLEIPELPEIAVIPDLPPLPPLPFKQFDYDAYKKDGDAYLKKWTEEFKENFNEEYELRFEEWGKKVEERTKERQERLEKREEERQERMEERREQQEKRREAAEARREETRGRVKALAEKSRRNSFIISSDDEAPNVFYFSSDGENKKYKVKKTIKIKMPKSTRLKMNVRHGEVKLASTVKNINASLRYASLLASTIDGDRTNIKASYSPVSVQKWNYGQLKTDYSDKVTLKEVGELKLNAVSSNVIIDRLGNKAFVVNNLGELVINSISTNFSDLDVSVQNGEFRCKIPNTALSLYLNGTKSKMVYPENLKMNRTKNFDNVVLKGFQLQNNSGRSIRVNSKYSDIVLENR